MDNFDLTEEEAALYMAVTRARIKKIEAKARRRLSMTDEEKDLLRLYKKMENDPELKELITTLVLAGSEIHRGEHKEPG